MLNTVIFDMDGLLIDSEPLWQEVGIQVLREFGISLTLEQYHSSTGLRTPEWIEHWFNEYNIDVKHAEETVKAIEDEAIQSIKTRGIAFEGTNYILDFFRKQDFKIGLATSSPLRLVEVVTEKLGIASYFSAYSSAESLPYGKPHPQVYLNCAEQLKAAPVHCLCFEDSFNGFISAKAARMKCIIVPAIDQQQNPKWNAADLQLKSLLDFNQQLLGTIF
jgi:sugar-phosphatase